MLICTLLLQNRIVLITKKQHNEVGMEGTITAYQLVIIFQLVLEKVINFYFKQKL